MMNFASLRNSTEFEKAVRQFIVALFIWIFALIVYIAAVTVGHCNSAKLEEAQKVLNAATVVKGYKAVDTPQTPQQSSVSSLSGVVNSLGLSDRVARLDSTANEAVLQLTKIYPDELGKLLSAMGSSAMRVNSAEIKAMEVNGERLLSVTMSVGGAAK